MGVRESLNGPKNMAQKKSKERREEPLGTMSYHTKHKFSGTNQKPERRRPFGTGLPLGLRGWSLLGCATDTKIDQFI